MGNTYDSTFLQLFNPQVCDLIWLEIQSPHHIASAGMTQAVSSNFDNPALSLDKEFREQIRYDYGFFDLKKLLALNDPKYADKLWVAENTTLGNRGDMTLPEKGVFRVHRYKERIGGSVSKYAKPSESLYEDGRYVYQEYWNGLIAINKNTGENFIVMVAPSYRGYVKSVSKHGNEILVHTNQDGDFLINMNSLEYQRMQDKSH